LNVVLAIHFACSFTGSKPKWPLDACSHRVDIIVEEKCIAADGKACDDPMESDGTCPSGCSSEKSDAGELFRFGDINAICYMCLCECSNVMDSEEYAADQPACFDIEGSQRDEYCQDYKDYRQAQSRNKMLGTAVVVFVNTLIKKMITGTQPLMGLHDQADDMGSIAFRTFLLQFCMTGLLVILLRADLHLPVMDAAPTEKYGNMGAKWYATVGAPLVKTMFINFLAPAITHAGKANTMPMIKLKMKEKKAATQNGLNKVYDSCTDSWNMAASYGELLMPMAVCLLYSSGIPLLLWIATFGFCFKYWVDKWCMLRLYEKPTLVDDDMFTQFGGTYGIMSICLFLKVGLGTWLYASAGGTDPRKEYAGHISRPYVVPYLLMGIIVITYWVLAQFFGFDAVEFLKNRCKRKKKQQPEAAAAESEEESDDTEKSVEVPPPTPDDDDDDDEDQDSSSEDLPPFSVAYREKKLVNADYDYEMDEVGLPLPPPPPLLLAVAAAAGFCSCTAGCWLLVVADALLAVAAVLLSLHFAAATALCLLACCCHRLSWRRRWRKLLAKRWPSLPQGRRSCQKVYTKP
jgi:hypothetical protein